MKGCKSFFWTLEFNLRSSQFIFKCSFDAVKKIRSSEGIRGLYKGSSVLILLITPMQAIRFSANDFFRFHLKDKRTKWVFKFENCAFPMFCIFRSIFYQVCEAEPKKSEKCFKIEENCECCTLCELEKFITSNLEQVATWNFLRLQLNAKSKNPQNCN